MDVLLVTTIGHLVSSAILVISGALVFSQGPKKTLNRLFFISTIFAGIFGVSLSIGINLPPSPLAYWVWFANIVDVFIVATYLHFTFVMLKKEHEARWIIRVVYIVGFLIFIAAILFPSLFIPEISSKLFTKSYLSAGPIYVAMFIYFSSVFFFAFAALIRAYFVQHENKKQLEYFIVATILGYGVAPIDFFLVFDIPVSPFYGMFFGLYMVPIAYGILADNLMDIRLVLKRAFLYSLIIGFIAAVLTLLIFLNDFFVSTVPWVQFWTIPIFTAFTSFIIGRLFWVKSAEADRIKYEFVTVAAHKLRTPLTRISWSTRELIDSTEEKKVLEYAYHIQQSTNRLIELTNVIFETTQDEAADVAYVKERIGLVEMTNEVFERLKPIVEEKKLTMSVHVDNEIYVNADKRRIQAVLEVLLENAVNYTPNGGFVQVIVYDKKNRIYYSVRDSGIGVSPEERRRIFSRFYRTDAAKRMDTEGVGLGLAMAKSIITKHGGKIGVESHGENEGSIFWFTLPKN